MKPKTKVAVLTTLFLSVIACIVILPGMTGGDALILGLLMLNLPFFTVRTCCFMFLKENRIDHIRNLVAERQKHYDIMMYLMDKCGYYFGYKEIYKILKKNPHLRLHRFAPFRAWYKEWIDGARCMAYAAIKDYSPERNLDYDEYYDPSAPPTARYFEEHECTWDDGLDDCGNPKPLTRDDIEEVVEDALEDYGRKHERNSVADGLSIGIGIGIGNSLTGGHGLGSSR